MGAVSSKLRPTETNYSIPFDWQHTVHSTSGDGRWLVYRNGDTDQLVVHDLKNRTTVGYPEPGIRGAMTISHLRFGPRPIRSFAFTALAPWVLRYALQVFPVLPAACASRAQ